MFHHKTGIAGSLFGITLAALAIGCGAPEFGDGEPTAQVAFALTAIPADVACVRLTASGPGRTLTRKFTAAAGGSISEKLSGLPIGDVTFLAEAFSAACEDVTSTRIPSWVSDPATITVSADRLSSLELTLHRNGRVRVDVSFAEDPVCGPVGASCLDGTACCSRVCSAGACTVTPDAGTGG